MPDLIPPVAGQPRTTATSEVDLMTALTVIYNELKGSESAAGVATLRALLDGEYQPLDADLTAIAALVTSAYGRGLLTDADAAAFTARLRALLDGTYDSLKSKYTAGQYYGPAGAATGTISIDSGAASATVWDQEGITIDRIGVEVTTAAVGVVAPLYIYRNDGAGYLGDQLLSAGSVNASTTGFKEIILGSSLALPAGRVFCVMGGATGGIVTCRSIVGIPTGARLLTANLSSTERSGFFLPSGFSGQATFPAGAAPNRGVMFAMRAA